MRALDVAARDLLHRHGAVHDAVETLNELLAASERYGSIPAQAEALRAAVPPPTPRSAIWISPAKTRRARGISSGASARSTACT